MSREWVDWHRGYEGDQPLSKRLKVVQSRLSEALDRAPPGPLRVISLCAGDGRDLLGVLFSHPRVAEVRARLVEREPQLASSGRVQAARLGLHAVEFVAGDASKTRAFAGAVPADLVLVCGVFGNIGDADVQGTIAHLPELCARNATVVWTRGRFEPDLTPAIRDWFREAGFEELSFVTILETTASVGAHQLVRAPRPYRDDVDLFTFLPGELRPSTQGRSPGDLTPSDPGS